MVVPILAYRINCVIAYLKSGFCNIFQLIGNDDFCDNGLLITRLFSRPLWMISQLNNDIMASAMVERFHSQPNMCVHYDQEIATKCDITSINLKGKWLISR